MSILFKRSQTLYSDVLERLGDTVNATARPAAQAMAQVYYDALRRAYNQAGIRTKTGNLYRSIYQAFRVKESTPTQVKYVINVAGGKKKVGAGNHLHLIEFGHQMRYQVIKSKKTGDWVTAVRREKQGMPAPRRGASRAEKDAYYVLRKKGVTFVKAKPFINATYENPDLVRKAQEAAQQAIDNVLSRT